MPGAAKDRIEALAQEIGGVAVEADVADESAARRAVDEAAGALGGLDAVLNIAGVQLLAPFSDGRSDEWRTLLNVNVFGLLIVTHAALRRELHSEGIRVMIVSPGWVNTELGQNMRDAGIRDNLQWRQEEIGLDPREVGRQTVLAQPRRVMLHEIAIMSIDED